MLAIYCRTSKNKEEGKDYSIASQKRGGVKLAEALGIIYKFYVDEGISGTLDIVVRPSFAMMMSDIKKKKVSAIYCIDQSRIERNTSTWRFFVGECVNNNCLYYPNGKELDLTDPDSMLFANLLSLVNSYYAEITSKKVKDANYNKAKVGKTHGLKAYGYGRDKDNNFIISEDEAIQVKRIFEWSLHGVGTYTIANTLNEERVPTKFNSFKGSITRKDKYTKREVQFDKSKVLWRGNVIHDMLKNELYKGTRVWGDLRIEVPAIISKNLWQKVNDNLAQNKKNVGRREEYPYLLNGLVFCSHCGNEVIGKTRLKGNDNAYKCKGKRPPHKDCSDSRGLSLPKLETFIIHHLFYSKDLKKLLSNAPKNTTESKQLRRKIELKEKELGEHNSAIDRLYKLMQIKELTGDSRIVNDYVAAKVKQKIVVAEIETLTIKISEVESEVRNNRTKSIIESYTGEIEFDVVKKLVHSLIDRIEIHHTKESKSGFFSLKVKYKNYDEYSTFATNWIALDWLWMGHYRGSALTTDDLIEDGLQAKYLAKKRGTRVPSKKGFTGYESVSFKHDTIALNPEELITFYTPT